MSAKCCDKSEAEFSFEEYLRLQKLAAESGLGIEAFKRRCVRKVLFPPSLKARILTALRSMLPVTPSAPNRHPS